MRIAVLGVQPEIVRWWMCGSAKINRNERGESTMKLTRASIVFLFLGAAVLIRGQEYVISTFAGGAPPPTPVMAVDMPIGTVVQGVAADALGNTYFVAFFCVFKLDHNGVVTRIAGNARAGYSGDGGPATSAQLMLDRFDIGDVGPLPPGIAVDSSGNVYVADNGNNRIRRISPDGIITTVAGNGTYGFSGDGGPATLAQLSSVAGLAVDVTGNLWIADSSANRIRQVSSNGIISTVAGTGGCGFSGDGGPAAASQICGPAGIAADTAGNFFIADCLNNRIRRVSPDGTITTVAIQLSEPTNVAVDQAGNLFDADTYDGYNSSFQVVRKISPSGAATIVAGFDCWAVFGEDQPCTPVPGDGTIATKTYLDGPIGLAVDNSGNLLIADDRRRIGKVSSDGTITSVAGNGEKVFSGDGGPATSAQLAGPEGVAVDGAGNVFIADYVDDRIRKVSPNGIITTVAGNGTYGFSGDGGPATSAQLAPITVTVDGAGNVFFFDIPNRSIRKVSLDGIVTSVTSFRFNGSEYFVAADSAGDLFTPCPELAYTVCEISPGATIRRVAGNGTYGFSGDGGSAASAQLSYTYSGGVALDSAGNLFIADSPNNRIRKVTPDGTITTIAGSGPTNPTGRSPGGFSGDGGPATSAQLADPEGVAVDDAGNIFIADSGNNRIRKVSADGIITTIAGDGAGGYSGDGGPATRASLWGNSLAVDTAGNVYVADAGNAIRILRPVPMHRRRPGTER